MLNEAIHEALNKQINRELYASYLYLAMAANFEAMNLSGFAHWMLVQSKEENEHAMRIFEHLNDRNAKVVLQAIDKPPSDFGTPLEIFQQALEHEQTVTEHINELYALAVEEADYATQAFLQWFVEEQVEEEKITGALVDQLKMVGEDSTALFILDRELAVREADEDAEVE